MTRTANQIPATPRNATAAALFLGSTATAAYCPTGLSNATATGLARLIAAAASQGCTFDV